MELLIIVLMDHGSSQNRMINDCSIPYCVRTGCKHGQTPLSRRIDLKNYLVAVNTWFIRVSAKKFSQTCCFSNGFDSLHSAHVHSTPTASHNFWAVKQALRQNWCVADFGMLIGISKSATHYFLHVKGTQPVEVLWAYFVSTQTRLFRRCSGEVPLPCLRSPCKMWKFCRSSSCKKEGLMAE